MHKPSFYITNLIPEVAKDIGIGIKSAKRSGTLSKSNKTEKKE